MLNRFLLANVTCFVGSPGNPVASSVRSTHNGRQHSADGGFWPRWRHLTAKVRGGSDCCCVGVCRLTRFGALAQHTRKAPGPLGRHRQLARGRGSGAFSVSMDAHAVVGRERRCSARDGAEDGRDAGAHVPLEPPGGLGGRRAHLDDVSCSALQRGARGSIAPATVNSSSALCVNELRVGGPHEVDAEDRLLHREPKLRTIRKVIRGRRHLATALRARTTAGECVALLLKG